METNDTIGINVMELRFNDNTEFGRRFNLVGELWDAANEEGISEEERKKRLEEYSHQKLCLEQGWY